MGGAESGLKSLISLPHHSPFQGVRLIGVVAGYLLGASRTKASVQDWRKVDGFGMARSAGYLEGAVLSAGRGSSDGQEGTQTSRTPPE